LNDEKAGVFGGEGKIYSFGINYWAWTNVKIMLNLAYVDHDKYANYKSKFSVPESGFDYYYAAMRFEVDF